MLQTAHAYNRDYPYELHQCTVLYQWIYVRITYSIVMRLMNESIIHALTAFENLMLLSYPAVYTHPELSWQPKENNRKPYSHQNSSETSAHSHTKPRDNKIAARSVLHTPAWPKSLCYLCKPSQPSRNGFSPGRQKGPRAARPPRNIECGISMCLERMCLTIPSTRGGLLPVLEFREGRAEPGVNRKPSTSLSLSRSLAKSIIQRISHPAVSIIVRGSPWYISGYSIVSELLCV